MEAIGRLKLDRKDGQAVKVSFPGLRTDPVLDNHENLQGGEVIVSSETMMTVRVEQIRKNHVSLVFEAPHSVKLLREELLSRGKPKEFQVNIV